MKERGFFVLFGTFIIFVYLGKVVERVFFFILDVVVDMVVFFYFFIGNFDGVVDFL